MIGGWINEMPKVGYIADFGIVHHHSITENVSKSIFICSLEKEPPWTAHRCNSAKKRYNGIYTSFFLKGDISMIHEKWHNNKTLKKVTCIQTDAKKYIVDRALTVGKTYEVKNETEEFLFIIDNTGKVGGYYKEYFEEV